MEYPLGPNSALMQYGHVKGVETAININYEYAALVHYVSNSKSVDEIGVEAICSVVLCRKIQSV